MSWNQPTNNQPPTGGWSSSGNPPTGNNGWGPTPPGTPPHFGPPGGAAPVPSASGWGAPPAVTAAPAPTPAVQPGWGARKDDPQTRGRANSDLQKPSWDSVPGWSSGVSSNTNNGWGSQQPPAPAGPGGWGQAAPQARVQNDNSWGNRPNQPPAAEGGWGRPQAPTVPVSGGWNSNSTNLQAGGWNQPAPPVPQPAPIVAGGWDSKPAAPIPAQQPQDWNRPAPWNQDQQPQAAATTGWGGAPATINPLTQPPPSVQASLQPNAQQQQQPRQPGQSQAQQRGKSPMRRDLQPPSAQQQGGEDREVRKMKSNTGLENRGGRGGLGSVGMLSRGQVASAGAGAKDGAGTSATNPMRLFNRSFNEVNRSLGMPATDEVKIRRHNRPQHRKVETDVSKAIGVYVYGFPKWVRVKEILEIFAEFGGIVNVGIVSKPQRDQRAYAYVDYEEVGIAAKAIAATKGKTYFDMKDPLEIAPHFDSELANASFNKKEKESTTAPVSTAEKTTTEKAAPEKAAAVKTTAASENKKEEKREKRLAPTPTGDTSATSANESTKDEHALNKRTLHIANVPQNVDKSEIEKLFSVYGDIRRLHIVQRPKEKRAFAFVTYRTEEEARNALNSTKEGKHLGMSEPLKIEYSKAEERGERTPTSSRNSASTRATDKPWKKGEALKNFDKERTPASSSSAAAEKPRPARKSGRIAVYVREVSADATEESLKARFSAVGPVRTVHIVDRLDTGRCAVIAFEKGEDASKAVKDKVEGVVFPRQRRLTVYGIPAGVTEAELKTWFAESGEVRRAEFISAAKASGAEDTSAASSPTTESADKEATAASDEPRIVEVEFSRGDTAIVAFLRLLDNGYGESKITVRTEAGSAVPNFPSSESPDPAAVISMDMMLDPAHLAAEEYLGYSTEEDDVDDVEVVHVDLNELNAEAPASVEAAAASAVEPTPAVEEAVAVATTVEVKETITIVEEKKEDVTVVVTEVAATATTVKEE
ncbi:hypothetical protein HDU76_009191 [Blyttiomyces sp. JEL0837]|nr:hypothetical protein HDU76_009191 [Blyttiomyces sp. JEL0837]